MDTKTVIANATEKFNNITPSVLALARVAGITPAKFAEAVYASDENDEFLSEVASVGVKLAVKKAKEDEKERKSRKNA